MFPGALKRKQIAPGKCSSIFLTAFSFEEREKMLCQEDTKRLSFDALGSLSSSTEVRIMLESEIASWWLTTSLAS